MPCTLRRINAPVPACEKFLFSRAIRLHTSQIAAVILFDLETVDIRRVGLEQANLVEGCSEYKI